MIVFLGDSFTWGQGLNLEKWNIEGNIDNKEYILPPEFNPELNSYEDDEYRKKHHFPNLVSNYLNKSYCSIWGNGGSNKNIIDILKNINSQFYAGIDSSIDFFVIQFTCPSRSLPDDFSDEAMEGEIIKVNDIITAYGKKWVGFSWRPEVGNLLKFKWKNNYIPLYYNEVEYSNFEELLKENEESHILTLDKKYQKQSDGHFSLEGHQLVANSIIRKLQKNNIY